MKDEIPPRANLYVRFFCPFIFLVRESEVPEYLRLAFYNGSRRIWKSVVRRSYLNERTRTYTFLFTEEEMESISNMAGDKELLTLREENTKMREALRYYAQESNQNKDGLYVLSHDGWYDSSGQYIVPFDNGTTAQKALSSLLP